MADVTIRIIVGIALNAAPPELWKEPCAAANAFQSAFATAGVRADGCLPIT